MKGDPRGVTRCPKCHKEIRGWKDKSRKTRYEITTERGVRVATMSHFDVEHPDLGVRERAVLADLAVRRLRPL